MAQERGIDRYYRQIREIRDEYELTHEEARERWGDFFAPGGSPIKPIKKPVAAAKIKLSARTSDKTENLCPYCRDALPVDGKQILTCAPCKTRYHRECFEHDLGGSCGTIGCAARKKVVRPHVPFTMPASQADPAPTYFTVRQEGREPTQFSTAIDAYRYASMIIAPGRDVTVTPYEPAFTDKPSTDEQAEAAALKELEKPTQDESRIVRILRVGFEALHDRLGPALIPLIMLLIAIVAKVILAISKVWS